MSILNINGMAMPDPSALTLGYSDLDGDSTTRNEQGVLQRDRIRGSIRKLTCKWSAINNSDAVTILQAVSAPSFSVTFFDPMAGGDSTLTGYVGDRSGDAVATQTNGRWDIGFDITEY